ncbi:Protein OPY2 [Coniochaeta hoffmannii]|uniref:Protein OPY2 n=1 Tax=Coniochaeta hoffmannii TaxID=91930 RepID=A0AA38RCS6_9PEZI|nr:Protein OPY2 [Coniochaeta hoffmannii]
MTTTFRTSAAFDHSLVTRGCVQCDTTKKLVCPTDCAPNQQCQFYYPTNCNECARAYCAASDLTTATPTPAPASSTPSVGAIAGGVIGGVIAIAVVTYLVWRYCIKAKRQPIEQETWDEDPAETTDAAEKAFAQRRTQRQSTHTVHSIASTVLTRASNIIQIAYIPGVTNRATPTSPTILVPPVPPIPIAVSQANTPTSTDDQHFFVLGDSRDSTYSALSGYTERTSYARTSYAPRSSVASTIYGKNAVIVAPAQTGMRAKPEMVSVRSKNSAGSNTPPVPSVDYDKYTSLRAPSPTGSTFSVGSTFLNNASAATAMAARPQMIRVGSAQSKKTAVSKLRDSESSSSTPPRDSLRESQAGTLIEDSPTPSQGPFSDPADELHRMKSTTSLSAVIEEATRRASQRDSGDQRGRERSPFGDEHAMKD